MRAPASRSDLGIFACDDFDLFSASKLHVGTHHRAGDVWTWPFKQAYVGTSKDGTAGNAQLFIHLWDAVRSVGKYKWYEWTCKADPDAVVIPTRLRSHLSSHTAHTPMYFTNCNAYPSNPAFPMMYGPLEVFSTEAIVKYFATKSVCTHMNFWSWGEDVYMQECMRRLGVPGVYDANLVGNDGCGYKNCHEDWKASFHRFKSKYAWMECWDQAHR